MALSDHQRQRKIKSYEDKGVKALANQEFMVAKQYFEGILKIDPDHENAPLLVEKAIVGQAEQWNFLKRWLTELACRIKIMIGKPEGAKDDLEILFKSNPSSMRLGAAYGKVAAKLEATVDAVRAWEAVVRVKPDHVGALKALGDAYLANQQFELEAKVYQKLHSLKPKDATIERRQRDSSARAYQQVGVDDQLKEKRGEIERKKLEEKDPVVLKERADQLQSELAEKGDDQALMKEIYELRKLAEDWPGCNDILKELLRLEPENLDYARQLVRVQKLVEDYSGAGETLVMLLAKEPESLDYNYQIAEIKVLSIEKFMEGDSTNEELKSQLAELIDDKNRKEIALREFQLAHNPNDLDLLTTLGDLYIKLAEWDQAITHLQAASRNPQRVFMALTMLGDCFMGKELYEIAIEQYEKALTKATDGYGGRMLDRTKHIYYQLGHAYKLKGDLDGAIEAMKPLYETDIDYLKVKEFFEALYKEKQDGAE